VKHHQIPSLIEHREHISLPVRTWTLRRQQIARHGIVPYRDEGVPYNPAELAGHEHSHLLSLLGSGRTPGVK
jgi:hypothetical protein